MTESTGRERQCFDKNGIDVVGRGESRGVIIKCSRQECRFQGPVLTGGGVRTDIHFAIKAPHGT